MNEEQIDALIDKLLLNWHGDKELFPFGFSGYIEHKLRKDLWTLVDKLQRHGL